MRNEEFSNKVQAVLFIAIVIILIGLSIWSCHKDICWRCEVHSKFVKPNPSGPVEIIGVYEFCDKTESEIKEWMLFNTYTDTVYIQSTRCTN